MVCHPLSEAARHLRRLTVVAGGDVSHPLKTWLNGSMHMIPSDPGPPLCAHPRPQYQPYYHPSNTHLSQHAGIPQHLVAPDSSVAQTPRHVRRDSCCLVDPDYHVRTSQGCHVASQGYFQPPGGDEGYPQDHPESRGHSPQQQVDIDGLVQERRNSSALAMELRLSCTNPPTATGRYRWVSARKT